MGAGRVRGAAVLLSVLVASLAAGCGDDGDGEGQGASTTTTEVTTTTSTPASSSTTSTSAPPLGDAPAFHDDVASGSGCTPGGGELPDGWWYGTLSAPPAATLELDLACYYVGAAAEAEAASRGDEVSNDYYVVNDNPAVRTLPVADGATAACVDLATELQLVACAPNEVAADWAVWVRVAGGTVDRILEQYAP